MRDVPHCNKARAVILVGLLLCFFQTIFFDILVPLETLKELDYTQHLATCDLPALFQDELLLRFHRHDKYPGKIEHEGYAVGFPHLYKVGGSSIKSMLREQAQNANMNVREVTECQNFCTYKARKFFDNCFVGQRDKSENDQLFQLYKSIPVAKCKMAVFNVTNGVFYGHENYAEMEYRFNHLKQLERHYIAMFREPESRYESLFRYHAEGRPGNYAQIHGVNSPKKFQNKFNEFLSKQSNQHSMVYLSQNAPENILNHVGKTRKQDIDTSDWKTMFPSKNLQCKTQEVVFQNMVDNYAVVGVLERMEEVLEVLRCRFPWFQEHTMHHKNPTTGFFKDTPLTRNKNLLKMITPSENVLYEVANRILTADIQNCRDPKMGGT